MKGAAAVALTSMKGAATVALTSWWELVRNEATSITERTAGTSQYVVSRLTCSSLPILCCPRFSFTSLLGRVQRRYALTSIKGAAAVALTSMKGAATVALTSWWELVRNEAASITERTAGTSQYVVSRLTCSSLPILCCPRFSFTSLLGRVQRRYALTSIKGAAAVALTSMKGAATVALTSWWELVRNEAASITERTAGTSQYVVSRLTCSSLPILCCPRFSFTSLLGRVQRRYALTSIKGAAAVALTSMKGAATVALTSWWELVRNEAASITERTAGTSQYVVSRLTCSSLPILCCPRFSFTSLLGRVQRRYALTSIKGAAAVALTSMKGAATVALTSWWELVRNEAASITERTAGTSQYVVSRLTCSSLPILCCPRFSFTSLLGRVQRRYALTSIKGAAAVALTSMKGAATVALTSWWELVRNEAASITERTAGTSQYVVSRLTCSSLPILCCPRFCFTSLLGRVQRRYALTSIKGAAAVALTSMKGAATVALTSWWELVRNEATSITERTAGTSQYVVSRLNCSSLSISCCPRFCFTSLLGRVQRRYALTSIKGAAAVALTSMKGAAAVALTSWWEFVRNEAASITERTAGTSQYVVSRLNCSSLPISCCPRFCFTSLLGRVQRRYAFTSMKGAAAVALTSMKGAATVALT